MTRVGHLVRRCCWPVTIPYRLYRGRISAQLIASYVLVVFLALIVANAAVVAALFGLLPDYVAGGDETVTDWSMGEKARTVSVALGTETVAAARGDDADAARASMTKTFGGVVDRGRSAPSPPTGRRAGPGPGWTGSTSRW